MRHRSSRGGAVPPPAPRLVVPGRELTGPGDWPRVFGRAAPLVVEIGFGKDTFLLARAAADPGRDHVGVERDPARVEAFLAEAARRGLANVRALPVSAELALGSCFEDGSVAVLHVYFPDPWPKARHAGNRLVQPWFAREARRVLEPEGVLHLATDDAAYAERMLDVLEGAGLFRNLGGPRSTSSSPALGWETKFERLWRSRGRVIRHMAFSPAPGRSATLAAPWTGSGAPGGTPT